VRNTPGLWRDVETYLAERISEVLSGSSAPITVRVFGDDLPTLRAKADDVRDVLGGSPGITDAKVEIQQDEPQIQITENLAAAQRYGLKPGDVRRAAGVLVAGEEVGDIYSGGKTYDVQVWSTAQTRSSPSAISQMLIDTPKGGQVKLGDVAEVKLVPTPNSIKHENTKRRIDVTATTDSKDLGKVISELQPRLAGVAYPLGMHAELLGEYQERQAAQDRILILALGALAAIFLLLQASFRNTRLAALAFITLPMAMAGGVIAALLGGGILSLGSLVGLFTVFGIAARNKIMLISHYRHLEREEGMTFGPELVLRGAQERLRPILMTALSTGLAILPLVVAGEIPGAEIEHPMAVVILGGLVTSTLLNLFVVPALYLRFGRSQSDDTDPPAPPEADDKQLVHGGSR
jgi:Cu/Ag efflux pump CusA